MTATLSVVPAIYEHIAPIAIHMRQADRDELEAGSGRAPFDALEFSFGKSEQVWTVLIDNVPAGMFGCGYLNVLARKGSPWFFATDAVERNKVALVRSSVFWRDQLLERYDDLANLVDARNAVSIRWLRWLGFTMSEPLPAGRLGLPHRYFRLRRADV